VLRRRTVRFLGAGGDALRRRRAAGGGRRARPASAPARARGERAPSASTIGARSENRSVSRARGGRRRASDESATVGSDGKAGSEQRFFLAMLRNGPYSQAVFGRGEEFFRREGAVNSDEMFVAGEVR
jgi:hypothetical protein